MESTLPAPTISFTIPSLHDTTVLSCRVYHPDSLSATALSWRGEEDGWGGQVAVFAHPYAPLGGSADDGIVDVVAGALVRGGYLVGTFNFRGAGDSEGRTSWTAKGEKDDYISVAAFMLYYAHHLRGPSAPSRTEPPVFLMGGYSYGAMITTLLPPLPDLLPPFETPELGSAAAEIRLRAEHLAERERDVLARAREVRRSRTRSSPGRSPGIRVGGTESGDGSFVSERERAWKTTGDAVGRKRREGEGEQKESLVRLERIGLVVPRAAYLLVSPLQGLVTHLATMSFLPSRFSLPPVSKIRNTFQHKTETPEDAEPQQQEPESRESAPEELKLIQNPTLAIFGDRDVFVAVAKLRGWARRLQGAPGSRFHAVEVSTAGHFWIEEGVLDKMLGAVSGYSRRLLRETPAS